MGTKQKIETAQTFKSLFVKSIAFATIILVFIILFESRQIFVEDNSNAHIEWKWEWYNKMRQANIPIDVLFIGNSHLLTGFDPYLFTRSSGMTSFLLGAPGVGVADLYYSLEAALKIRKPKVVVLETYAINSLDPYELDKGSLNDQINSFRAREYSLDKLMSTFSLFKYNNYPIAWCETFRNHNFIFAKPSQVLRNIMGDGPVIAKKENIYLGQFARFEKGLSEKTLERYKNEGAPVDGKKFTVSASSVKYTEKIAQLCRENGIQLIFLTIPMYHEHVADYKVWKDRLHSHVGDLTPLWLDLQEKDLRNVYTADAFEDTYEVNQHLTGNGMKITAEMFYNYLVQEMPELPNRKNDKIWDDFLARLPR